MDQRITFHLDEHIGDAVAEGLRHKGIEVCTSAELSLLTATDESHLRYAAEHGQVIVTNDADFLRLHASGVQHAGIVYYRSGVRSVRQVIAGLEDLHASHSAKQMHNRVEFL